MADVKKVLQVTGNQIDKALLPIARERYNGRYAQSDGQGGLKFVDGGGGGGGVTKEYVDQRDNAILASAKQYTDTHGGGGGFLMVTFTKGAVQDGKTTVTSDTSYQLIDEAMTGKRPVFGQVKDKSLIHVFVASSSGGPRWIYFTRVNDEGTGIEIISLPKVSNNGTLETILFPSGGSGGYVTPEDYGAVGDGVADDTKAIQDALNAAQASGTEALCAKKYKTTRPLSVKCSAKFNDLTFTGTGYALEIIDVSDLTVSVHWLHSSDSGIIVKSQSEFVQDNTLVITRLYAANTGVLFESYDPGLEYCNVNLNGKIEATNDTCIKGIAHGQGWVGEIKVISGELNSSHGYGYNFDSEKDEGITAVRSIGVGLEVCKKGIRLKNAVLCEFVNCRREGSNPIELIGPCYSIKFSGYRTREDDVNISKLTTKGKGTEPNIIWDEPVCISGSDAATNRGAYIGRDLRFYVVPMPNNGVADDGTSTNIRALKDRDHVFTSAYVRKDSKVKLTKYHGLEGINKIDLYCSPTAEIYAEDGKILIGKPDAWGWYEAVAFDPPYSGYSGWKFFKRTEVAL